MIHALAHRRQHSAGVTHLLQLFPSPQGRQKRKTFCLRIKFGLMCRSYERKCVHLFFPHINSCFVLDRTLHIYVCPLDLYSAMKCYLTLLCSCVFCYELVTERLDDRFSVFLPNKKCKSWLVLAGVKQKPI